MSYEARTYDNEHGDPVVVLVVTGTHDVSRIVHVLAAGNCEQGDLGRSIATRLRRHNRGRDALNLLHSHGGKNLLEPLGSGDPKAGE